MYKKKFLNLLKKFVEMIEFQNSVQDWVSAIEFLLPSSKKLLEIILQL